MDPATIAAITKALKASKYLIDYIVDDQTTYYGLMRPEYIVLRGKGIAKGIKGRFDNGYLAIEVLKCDPTGKTKDEIKLMAAVFPAKMKFWNGPDLIPNKLNDGSMDMSLWHDLIWRFSKYIAELWGWSATEVRLWGNGILAAAWPHYAKFYPDAKAVHVKVHVAYNGTNWTARWWHKFTSLFALILFALTLAGCGGCSSPPDWEVVDSSGSVQYEEGE